jgi:hypothetical protein
MNLRALWSFASFAWKDSQRKDAKDRKARKGSFLRRNWRGRFQRDSDYMQFAIIH